MTDLLHSEYSVIL